MVEPLPPPPSPDDYPLAPDEPLPEVECSPPAPVHDSGEPPVDAERDQFSLGELLGVVAVMAMLLSAISSFGRWASPGSSPASLAKTYALVLGFGALASMIVLWWMPHVRRIVLVGWWALLILYIVTAAAALMMSP